MLQPRDIEDFLNCMLDMALVEAGAQDFPLLDVVHIFGHRYDQAADKPNYAVSFLIAAISADLKHVRVSGAEHADGGREKIVDWHYKADGRAGQDTQVQWCAPGHHAVLPAHQGAHISMGNSTWSKLSITTGRLV